MLSDAIKQDIRDRMKAISEVMPNFRSRHGQRIMIAEVARTLANISAPAEDHQLEEFKPSVGSTVLCINGGTGIGKSLAYSLPAYVLAKNKNKKLVISTATVALQEQLVGKDLPMFFKAAGITARVEIAKGRTRFVCVYRLLQVENDLRQLAILDHGRQAALDVNEETENNSHDVITQMIEDLGANTWNGDRDTFAGDIDDAAWRGITTDRHGCMSRNCPKYRSCAQMEARKRLKEADVIVANHDLLLADLVMGGGRVLPAPGESIYVIDEAHHLPEKAVSSFSSSNMIGAGRRMAEKLGGFSPSLSQSLPSFTREANELEEIADQIATDLGEAYRFLESLSHLKFTSGSSRPVLDFQSCIPDEFRDMGANIIARTASAMVILGQANDLLADAVTTDDLRRPANEKLMADVGFYLGRCDEMNTTWTLFLEEPAIDLPPIAKWIQAIKGKKTNDYQMNASPVMADSHLRKMFWEKAAGVVLASATMTSLGTFDDFLRQAGLSEYSGVTCVDLPSPFDYPSQGTLEIPAMKSSAKNYAPHTAEVSERVAQLIESSTEGVLVLFTSRRQMDEVATSLPANLRQVVQVQGEGSKNKILTEHKARIDRNEKSFIFGLDSFSEGVDLVGRYCSTVVIPKLPFGVPDDPVLSTLSDWIERRGGNSFMDIFVPSAARKLEQCIGRLIRTETDCGKVIVLDSRLWNTSYGRKMLRGLPPFKVIANGKEVKP